MLLLRKDSLKNSTTLNLFVCVHSNISLLLMHLPLHNVTFMLLNISLQVWIKVNEPETGSQWKKKAKTKSLSVCHLTVESE